MGKNQDLADAIAKAKPGDELVVSKSYNVYNTGPAMAQVIQRGISELQDAEKLGEEVLYNGASGVCVVVIETRVKVVRTFSHLEQE